MTGITWLVLLIVAVIGHAMALLWYIALKQKWSLCRRTIYQLPVDGAQLRRELRNSIHTPIHAVFLFAALGFGLFGNRSIVSFIVSVAVTFVWAEIWHYTSHRAMHWKSLHWIHKEHHLSRLNTPFTAISFSFFEKLIFDFGMVGFLALIDLIWSLNFFGIALWYIGYLVINSFSHANFEMRSPGYLRLFGRVSTSTTYHSLHHSRYTGNYGLATRCLDRLFGTEWEDYEALYQRITTDGDPLQKLREKVDKNSTRDQSIP